MGDHPWCSDTAKDAAVRAAVEHLRSLSDDHYQEFEDLVGIVGRINARLERLEAMIPKSVSASSAVEHENKGDGMATKRDEQAADYRAEAIARPFADAAERSSTVSKTGDGQSGMRTERVTLEITQFNNSGYKPASEWDWDFFLRGEALTDGESVRVVENEERQASAGDNEPWQKAILNDAVSIIVDGGDWGRGNSMDHGKLGAAVIWADKEIGRLRARVAVMEEARKRFDTALEEARDASGINDLIVQRDEAFDERDAAIRERDTLRAERITQALTADRFAAAVSEADTLRARVDELEARTSTAGEGSCAAPAASGGSVIRDMTDIVRSNTADADEKHAAMATLVEAVCPGWALTQAASVGGEGEPVAWEYDIPTPHGTGRGVTIIDPIEFPELWEEATGMPVINARPLVYQASQAASGGGESIGRKLSERLRRFADRLESVERDMPSGLPTAASGGEGGPAGWCAEWKQDGKLGSLLYRSHPDAMRDIPSQCNAVPLYRAPPQPRGWLNEEERKWIDHMKGNCVLPYAGMACMEAILARSSPPEVVLPENPYHPSGLREGFDHAIRIVRNELVNAGVEVKDATK